LKPAFPDRDRPEMVELPGDGMGRENSRRRFFSFIDERFPCGIAYQILENSDLSEEESNRIWSRYLLSLSRFDLVRIFREEGGIKDLKVGNLSRLSTSSLFPT
jgi:hypothetical protein